MSTRTQQFAEILSHENDANAGDFIDKFAARSGEKLPARMTWKCGNLGKLEARNIEFKEGIIAGKTGNELT